MEHRRFHLGKRTINDSNMGLEIIGDRRHIERVWSKQPSVSDWIKRPIGEAEKPCACSFAALRQTYDLALSVGDFTWAKPGKTALLGPCGCHHPTAMDGEHIARVIEAAEHYERAGPYVAHPIRTYPHVAIKERIGYWNKEVDPDRFERIDHDGASPTAATVETKSGCCTPQPMLFVDRLHGAEYNRVILGMGEHDRSTIENWQLGDQLMGLSVAHEKLESAVGLGRVGHRTIA